MNFTSEKTAFEIVKQLAHDFQANENFYLSADYQESEVRSDFINKLFTALGWDVNHEEQKNPFEQEVKVERGVDVRGVQKRADYAFYLQPNYRDVCFFVEAKKPYGNIATPANCFQAIRYGWNAQTPIAVLTDFKEFLILDSRFKPHVNTSSNSIIKRFHYTEYQDSDKFAEIYHLFSRAAVENKSLEKFSDALPKPRGTAAQRGLFPGAYKGIDGAFLEELDEYRRSLAHMFFSADPTLDGDTLTEITQRTIDRLVFIRFLEDRQIEADPIVSRFGERGSAWGDFLAASRRLDGIYNGIVFKKHDILDSSDFKVDDEKFANIREALSHLNTPYDFNIIPIHILGSIYEQFLGKIITAGAQRVRVDDKPEVRKAGGVYYTPQYIVRYIVSNTVGKMIGGKSPEQITQLKFADISCGSGSFLLEVYETLLEYHKRYYNTNSSKIKKGDCLERDGAYILSLKKRREILLNNVFGVDIDAQAVEVTQLSLYLKLLEGETIGTTHGYQQEFHETLLPSLSKNIICGNSLIGTDILSDQSFENNEERKLNPLDFTVGFPKIMEKGGFDVIVGNPPYVRIQGFPARQVEYLTHHYKSATGNCDLYVSFVERSYQLLKKSGRVGYIVPNKFLKTDYGTGLRKLIANEKALTGLVDFGHSQVFKATTYTCLLFLHKELHGNVEYANSEANHEALANLTFSSCPTSSLNQNAWLFSDGVTLNLLNKLTLNSKPLLDIPVHMGRGSSSGNDDIFMIKKGTDFEQEVLRLPVFSTDFNRFTFSGNGKWLIIFPYFMDGNDFKLISEGEFKRKYPKAFGYLKSKQHKLQLRKQYTEWYGFSAPRNLILHEQAQIAVPLLANKGIFTLIPKNTRGKLCPMASGGFTLTLGPGAPISAEYLLGLLNSKLLFWKLKQESNVFRGGWVTCTKQYFGQLPIMLPDKHKHEQMIRLVEQILETKNKSTGASTDKDKNYYESKCISIDRQIDDLVYAIYGLNEEEIKLIEGSTD